MYKTILVPIAPDQERDSKGALGVARSLLADGGKIYAVAVIEPMPHYVDHVLTPAIRAERRSYVEGALAQKLGEASDVEARVLKGSPARTIQAYADEIKADLIVVASHRPEMSDILLGSTAAWLMRHSQCAVHVLR
ncbi:MAG: universal stress protein [Pseudomonadota bacterium]